MRRWPEACAVVLMLASVAACRRAEIPARVTVVTTPDVAGTGVVAMLANRFTAESKAPTSIIVTEERLVRDLVRTGVADVVVTMSPELHRAIAQGGATRLAQTIAYDEYLIVGPKADPARAKRADTAPEALRRIARRDRAFCSPVDVPELRDREARLWEASPAKPDDDRRYRTCSGSAEEVLRESAKRRAYTLTDRSTFENAGRKVDLVPIVRGTPMLRSGLTMLLVRSPKRNRNAEWFVQWVMSHRGRDAIDRHRYAGGRRLFLPGR